MEGISSGSNSTGASTGGALKFLSNLPSRGFFSSAVPSSHPGECGFTYVIMTPLLQDQLIKTDQSNILIRSLMLKNSKGDSCSKEGKATSANQSMKKRLAEKVLDKASGKKALSSAHVSSSQASTSCTPNSDWLSLTVEKLRALLREKGLSAKGKKDELIARLQAANE